MSTPKFDAIEWTAGCGSCGGTGYKFFAEIPKGAGNGLLLKIMHDDSIIVSEWIGGVQTRNSEMVSREQAESLL